MFRFFPVSIEQGLDDAHSTPIARRKKESTRSKANVHYSKVEDDEEKGRHRTHTTCLTGGIFLLLLCRLSIYPIFGLWYFK